MENTGIEPSPLAYSQRTTPRILLNNDTKVISYPEIIDQVESFISADVLLAIIAFVLIILLLTKLDKNRKSTQRLTEQKLIFS